MTSALGGLQMRIMTDEIRHSNFYELYYFLNFLELHNKQLDFAHMLTTLTTITNQSSWFICINAAVVPYDYESNCSRRSLLDSQPVYNGRSFPPILNNFRGSVDSDAVSMVGGCGPRNQVPEAENLPLNLDKMCTYLAKILKFVLFLINNTPKNCTSQREKCTLL